MTHYLVGAEDEGRVEHIHADSQEEAVKAYLSGENDMGYEAEDFEGDRIIIVAFSNTSAFEVEVIPPTEVEVKLTKVKA